ncbi:LPO_1073/Vpar_1526 family protein [Acinetobacter lactucae]|uniref:LPO_1073/Vpar_1526 family protein n=1 Tax=Acinetobacter lactucae TaxID=1785128 RepID=UPI0039F6FE50
MSRLLGDTQSQEVSENSIAIQAGRDLNIGLSYRDVKDICIDLIEANYPVLREEARQVSMQYVEEFGGKFFERLQREDSVKTQEKLKDPDVQAAITTSVIHVARMTEKSHQEILCELLAEKIKNNEDEKSLLLNDAIEIMTKITKNQVLYLVLIHCLRRVSKLIIEEGNMRLHPDKSVQFNFYENEIPELIGNEVYKIDEFQLGYKGLALTNGLKSYAVPLNKFLNDRTDAPISDYSDETVMEDNDIFCSSFPRLSQIIRKFGFKTIKELDSLPITSISEVIATSYLKQVNFIG